MLRILAIVALEVAVVVFVATRFTGDDGDGVSAIGQLRLSAEGNVVTARLPVQDGSPALSELSIDWGDGSADALPVEDGSRAYTATVQHAYEDLDTFVVRLVARFADGSERAREESVSVMEAGTPQVVASGPAGSSGTTAGAPSASATPEPSPEATATPTSTPEATATPEPTVEPTPEPTVEPTPQPTPPPTPEPTQEPTPEPTQPPTPEPTAPAGNLPPQITILSIDPTGEDLVMRLVVLVVDPEGSLAGVGVDWGDGSSEDLVPSTGPIEADHVYPDSGIFPVTIFALDIQGEEASASVPASVP